MLRLRPFLLTLMTLLFLLAATGAAQEPTSEFRPVGPGDLQEQIPAAPLVFAAYAFVWFAFVAYLFFLWQRMKRIDAELKEISGRIGARRE